MKTKFIDKADHALFISPKEATYRANLHDEGWVLYTPDFKSIIGTYPTLKATATAVDEYENL